MTVARLHAALRWFVSTCVVSLGAMLVVNAPAAVGSGRVVSRAVATDVACPQSPSTRSGTDYSHRTIVTANFSRQDLTNANFQGSHLVGVNFLHANLTGADFSGATIDVHPIPTDFSFANLNSACFKKLTVNAPVYFTYADVTCASFDGMDLTRNVVFGSAPLRFTTPSSGCRPTFRSATLNCEFFAQWKTLDLSNASIAACASRVGPAIDFSNAQLSGVVFDGLDLSGSKWTGAVLEGASFNDAKLDGATGFAGTPGAPSRLAGAKFNRVSAPNVDFSNAYLYGAVFSRAELSGASFSGSFLAADLPNDIFVAATFQGAHLRNADFSNAQLQAVDFENASLYGSRKPPCAGGAGSAQNPRQCATASGASLNGTIFSSAYLAYVDFSAATTVVNGTHFDSAMLVGASFASADFTITGGAPPDFSNALLQGADLGQFANRAATNLTGAFVDFRSGGNALRVLLPAAFTQFRGGPGGVPVCVEVFYLAASIVPQNSVMTCPNSARAVCGPGVSSPPPANWNPGAKLAQNALPGWYQLAATYDEATSGAAVCNGLPTDVTW